MGNKYDQWPDPDVTDEITHEMYGYVSPFTGEYDHEGFMERLHEIGIRPNGITEYNISEQAMQLAKDIKDERRQRGEA